MLCTGDVTKVKILAGNLQIAQNILAVKSFGKFIHPHWLFDQNKC